MTAPEKPQKKRAKAVPKRRILFVCTGNTCRSAMAEIILRAELKKQNISGYISTGAGLNVLPGDVINPMAVAALKALGYGNRRHTAKQLTPAALKKASIIVCMTARHKSAIGAPENAYTAGEITGKYDVPDPYGQGIETYIDTARYLQEVTAAIIEVIRETEKINPKGERI